MHFNKHKLRSTSSWPVFEKAIYTPIRKSREGESSDSGFERLIPGSFMRSLTMFSAWVCLWMS